MTPQNPNSLPIAAIGVVEQIAKVLEEEILRGAYPRGYQLRQAEICSRFGVSRTPARDVLNRLHGSGLIRLVPNKSAVIDLPTLSELADVYAIRAELEALAAARVAGRRDPEMLALLADAQGAIDGFASTIDTSDPAGIAASGVAELRRLNDAFHVLVHVGARNERLVTEIDSLTRFFPKDSVFEAIRTSEEFSRLYLSEHHNLLAAIRAGDVESSRIIMRDHIMGSQQLITDFLRAQGYREN